MRVGIVGTGAMGKNHLRVVQTIPQLDLTCAMDVSPSRLSEACESLARVARCSALEQMVKHVDAVMVSTPTESHFEVARFFLEQGKHVIVEKPLTDTLEKADQLIRLAAEKGLILAAGHLERFNPAIMFVDGLVHQPLFIEAQRLGPFSPRSLDVNVVMDLMIHDLDIILHWDQTPVQVVSSVGVPIISNHIDIANVRLEFASGLVANVTASRVSLAKTRKLRIFQRNQYFSIDYQKRRVKSYQLVHNEIREQIPPMAEMEPLFSLWMNFYLSINEKNPRLNVSGTEARRALELAIRISQAIRNKIAA